MYCKEDIKNIETKSCVYLLFFIQSDNNYVGSTTGLKGRMYYHFTKLGKLDQNHGNSCLLNACEKYGIDNLRFSIIQKFPDETPVEEILSCEQFYIDKLNPEYNINKRVSSGMETSLSPEQVFDIRKKYSTFETRKDFEDYCNLNYSLSPDHLSRVAKGGSLWHLSEGSEYIKTNSLHKFKINYEKSGGPVNLVSHTRKLTEYQVGLFRWASLNNKSTSQLSQILGLKNDPSYRIDSGVICREITTMVDGSHLNLNNKIHIRSAKLPVYVYDLEGFFLFGGNLDEVSEKIDLASKYLISDALTGKYQSLKGYRFSENKVDKLPYKKMGKCDIWGQFSKDCLICYALGSKRLSDKLNISKRIVQSRPGKFKTRGSQEGKMFRKLTDQEIDEINKVTN